jgi:hypothetical protein
MVESGLLRVKPETLHEFLEDSTCFPARGSFVDKTTQEWPTRKVNRRSGGSDRKPTEKRSQVWKKGEVMNWSAIRFWAAIVLLLDASFGLWNHERFSNLAPKINIRLVAFVEVGVAILLLAVHYLF